MHIPTYYLTACPVTSKVREVQGWPARDNPSLICCPTARRAPYKLGDEIHKTRQAALRNGGAA